MEKRKKTVICMASSTDEAAKPAYGKEPAYQYKAGDIVKLKKQHPCGSSEWEILRTGSDFKLKCLGCGHLVMVPRRLVEKNTKKVTPKEE